MRYDAYNNPVGVTGTANFDTTGIASSLREGRLKDDGSTDRASVNGGGTGASYVVQRYDTLRGIARAAYGDETLWYLIAEANAPPGNVTPPAGTVIQLPAVTRSSNSASTFAVYNPADAIGDTSPAQIEPPPPPAQGGKGCGNVGKLIMIVVAVVVTVYTAGAAAGLFGVTGAAGGTALSTAALGSAAMTGGVGVAAGTTFATTGLATSIGLNATFAMSAAIGGAVGSAASQLVGKAIGEVDQFSWKNVGLAALSAGVTSGLGGVASGISAGLTTAVGEPGKYLAAAANGVIRSTVTQGLGSALGLQSFEWKAIAVSAITSPMNAGINDGISRVAGSALKDMGETFSSGLLGVINGATAQAVRMQVYSDGKIDWASIASDAFGNAIGNSVVDNLQSQRSDLLKAMRDAYGPDGSGDIYSNQNGERLSMYDPSSESDPQGSATAQDSNIGAGWEADVARRRRVSDPLGLRASAQDTESLWKSAGSLLRAPLFQPTSQLTDTSSDNEALAARMGDAGFDGYESVLTGGGTVRVTPGTGGLPARVNGVSVNERANASFQAAGDLLGMGEMYRDYKLLGALLADAKQQEIVDRMKSSLQERLGMMRIMPSERDLGATPGIGADGVARFDKADLIDRYADALRKLELSRQGVIELDTRTFLIKSIGSTRMTPSDWIEWNVDRYQRALADGIEEGQRRYDARTLRFPLDMPRDLQIGLYGGRIAQDAVIDANRAIGVPEGAGQLLSMNRWSFDPSGSGNYVRSDLLLDLGPNRLAEGLFLRTVVEGKSSVGAVWDSSAQLRRYYDWVSPRVIAVTPERSLVWNPSLRRIGR